MCAVRPDSLAKIVSTMDKMWRPQLKIANTASLEPCHKHLLFFRNTGADKDVRTPAPDLGKGLRFRAS